MAEAADSSSSTPPSFFRDRWESSKRQWEKNFSFLDDYKKHLQNRDKIPSWSDSDVDEFISSDPVHGPSLRTAREAAKIAAMGSAIGAISTAGIAWKYSKSPHGAALSLGAGAVFGWTFGQEFASHWLELYKMDTKTAQMKFMDWWESKHVVQT
ncbi:hypothetical protein GIB67_002749 [Kingdonia uniflora]|uniref:Succinate dehydrogenase subunit 6, mitochondrial n=1 Tax=Kingdonia uniflora TaxID=39325 RepID=A0A7J7MPZ5_9MAGN|nr:hypothetical protein GIB67_002749 [Kingdonia uniflora]